jgi:hypothetical protein
MTDNYHLIHAQGKRIAALEEQNAAFVERLARIETAIANLLPQPPRPSPSQSDHVLDRLLSRSSGEIAQRMSEAVPDALIRDIVRDNRGR